MTRHTVRGLLVVVLACGLGPLAFLGAVELGQRGMCALWHDEPLAYCLPVVSR